MSFRSSLLSLGVWGRRHCGSGQLTLLGTDPSSTPLIMPMRVHLDSIKRMMQSDFHIGTGLRQRNLKKSGECNQFKVESHRRDQDNVKFEEHLKSDQGLLLSSLWKLSVVHLLSGETAAM